MITIIVYILNTKYKSIYMKNKKNYFLTLKEEGSTGSVEQNIEALKMKTAARKPLFKKIYSELVLLNTCNHPVLI